MTHPAFARSAALVVAALLSLPALAAAPAEIKGSFVLGGVDAKLTHVRAKRIALDGEAGTFYAVLLSARPAEGDIELWRTGDPKERGNFLHLIFNAKGEIQVYEIGHTSAKSGHGLFGGVMEIKKVAFEVRGDHLSAHVRTNGEESFSDDRYTLDLTFEVPLEGK